MKLSGEHSDIRQRIRSRVTIEDRGHRSPCWISDRAAGGSLGAYTKMSAIIGGKKSIWYTHRLAYVVFVGPIPEGRELDHRCDQPKCCNPDHLAPVGRRENVLRGRGFPSVERSREKCIAGHRFDRENTWIDKLGRRHCRECRRRRCREHAARRRALGIRRNR